MLPPDTERVWNFLERQPALEGFILIGGTALALRLKHRRSEDLDFVYLETRLPGHRLDALRKIASESHFEFRLETDEVAIEEFADAGLNLHDFQQNFVVNNKVKVSFFVPDAPVAKVIASNPDSPVRIATLGELFKSKCLFWALRSKTRDWLDLFILTRDYEFSAADFRAAFQEAGVDDQYSLALSRLCSGMPLRDDEGYSHLLDAPPSLEEMKQHFKKLRDAIEIEEATSKFRKGQGKP